MCWFRLDLPVQRCEQRQIPLDAAGTLDKGPVRVSSGIVSGATLPAADLAYLSLIYAKF